VRGELFSFCRFFAQILSRYTLFCKEIIRKLKKSLSIQEEEIKKPGRPGKRSTMREQINLLYRSDLEPHEHGTGKNLDERPEVFCAAPCMQPE